MNGIHRQSALPVLLCSCTFLAELGPSVRPVHAEHLERGGYEQVEHSRPYNDEYIFAATRGLTSMPVPAALKGAL